ncbi:baeRF2 domain-containing protein [Actinomadura latina]|uniref:Peptide chain release factor 1 n=1 Tax=Actinomadura latina TaxID=163603 RepID=A0A846Z7K8_9ACTN|nr:Vms1/Ankzf1 family peptidyl-tRNA hydrolase [Actinomadura latina]NKZ06744.1 peptide chain release factor 1 [Actinomadura latina]
MDLAFLKTLYQRPGPYASVYADLTRNTEDAVKAVELRWRALRADLEDQNTPADTLRAVDRAIGEEIADRRSEGIVIFAADGEVLYNERLPSPPQNPHATLGPLPDVLPYLAERGEKIPHLLAVVDRRGGAIDCVTAKGDHVHIDVEGDEDYPIRKTKAGDWNQSRFQRAAENTWKLNAKKVAHEIDRAADRCGAEAIVIAGDARVRTAVLEEISEHVLEHTVETDKNTDIDDPELDAELRRLLQLKTYERVMTVAERFDRELANGERAVSGLPETTAALRHGQVETLLLTDDPDSDARLWIGPDPAQIAASADELREEFGIVDPEQERAAAALVRAAAATDSELVVLPSNGEDPSVPVGAVLRYTTTPGPDVFTQT